jgi:hypothetical protein
MKRQTITFESPKYHYLWTLEHNLEEFGSNIYSAATNYLSRITEHESKILKPEDFCKYVVSKDPSNFKCKFIHEQRNTKDKEDTK